MPVVLILTPLHLEYAAVSRHLTDKKAMVKEGAAYEIGHFKGRHHDYTVVLREPGMKNTDMALATERAIQHWSPDIAILCGIAGGIKDVQKGDVAIARSAFNYDSGKESDNGFLPRPVEYHFSEELLAYAQLVQRSDAWKKRCTDGAPQARLHIASVAAGDKVVAAVSNATYERITQFLSHCKFLEMEAAGFGLAIQRHRNLHALVVRGISDMCKGKVESDREEVDWQAVAAERAAGTAFELLWCLDASHFIHTGLTKASSALPKTPKERSANHSLKIFISYAKEDASSRDTLTRQLASLRRSGKVEIWSDNQIDLGTDWSDVTKERLRQADIIFLLLSEDFMASDHIWDNQLKESLERRDNGEAVMLVPILVRSCDVKNTPLDNIQGLPRDKKAIVLYPDLDEAWYNVALEIRYIVEHFEALVEKAQRNVSQNNSLALQQSIGTKNTISDGIIMVGMGTK
jgi:nucleoside phosphorylase